MPVSQGNNHPAVHKLARTFGRSVIEAACSSGQTILTIGRNDIGLVCRFLRDDHDLRYDHLSDLCGVDYQDKKPTRFEVVYQLYSSMLGDRLCIRVGVAGGDRVPTVTDVWPAADWLERECWEMFGIYFDRHPDVRRLHTLDEYGGFPLRKDFPLRGTVEIVEVAEGGVTWRPRS